eukprot:g206.t1
MKLIILALCAAAATAAFDDVNINTATEQQLDDLWQVGPSTAGKIRAYRNAFGPFASVEDLADVSGLSSTDVSQMSEKAAEGKNALPVVVPCPMSCEMKVVATRNHTVPLMHMTHNSNNATVGAHGPQVRHASCTDSVGRCADSQVIKHTCRALTKTALGEAVSATRRPDQCACFCWTEDAAGCGGLMSAPCVFKYLDNDGCSHTSTLAKQDGVAAKCWACGGDNQMPCKLRYTDNQGCGPGDELAMGGDAVNHPSAMGEHHGYNTVNPNPHPAGRCWVCGGDNQPMCDTKYSSNGGCAPGSAPGTDPGTAGKCWDPCGGDNRGPCASKYSHNEGCSNTTRLATHVLTNPKCWTCGGDNQMPCKHKYQDNQGCGPSDELAMGGDAVNNPQTRGELHGYNTKNPNGHPAGLCWVCGGNNQPMCDNKYPNNGGCSSGTEPGTGAGTAGKCWTVASGDASDCGADNRDPCTAKYSHNEGCSNTTRFATHELTNSKCRTCGGNNQMPCKHKYQDNQGCGPSDELAMGGDASNPNTRGDLHGYNTVNPNPQPAGRCWVCGGDNQPRCDTKYDVNNGCKEGHSGTHFKNKCWICTRSNVQC